MNIRQIVTVFYALCAFAAAAAFRALIEDRHRRAAYAVATLYLLGGALLLAYNIKELMA